MIFFGWFWMVGKPPTNIKTFTAQPENYGFWADWYIFNVLLESETILVIQILTAWNKTDSSIFTFWRIFSFFVKLENRTPVKT